MSVQKSKKPNVAKGSPGKPGASDAAAAAQPVRKRGRPRAFDAEVALKRAQESFRDTGFAATSMDDLSAAMGINRPSLYGAFGDKRELFIQAYQQYRNEMAALFAPDFDPALPLRESLQRIFATAISVYVSGKNGPRGCFSVMTAASEAMADPDIRAIVQKGVVGTDKAFADRFRLAMSRGELAPNSDCDALARLASATLQTIALRARARVPRADLDLVAKGAIDLIAGPGKK